MCLALLRWGKTKTTMKNIVSIALLLVMALGVASCHSTEENYKAAYDKAMEKHKEGVGAETYAKIEAERMRFTHVINGDSVRMVSMHVNDCKDNQNNPQQYSIIVGEFKQIFNAQNYAKRLQNEEGFPSYVLYGGPDMKYYVAIKGFEESDVAAAFLKGLDKKVKMKVLEPLPWILHRL